MLMPSHFQRFSMILKVPLLIWGKPSYALSLVMLMLTCLLRALDLKAQFTINPSRASEITMAEDPTTTTGLYRPVMTTFALDVFSGSSDIFGGEFDGYDLKGGEFEGGMEDIEVPRNTEGAEFGDSNEVSRKNGSIQVREYLISLQS